MIRLDLPLCGPILTTLELVRGLPSRHDRFASLLWGAPGTGKSHALDLIALELTGSKFAIEHFNGQDVAVDVVRNWKERGCYGNLFSKWTVKRIDELDCASVAAQAALLSWLDYLPPFYAVLATTNNYREMCRVDKGRLPRRFTQYQVEAPSTIAAAEYLQMQFKMPPAVAHQIAVGARPEGELEGVNMGAAVEDAFAIVAARRQAA
ncbi:MAG: hypothetical protein QOE70_4014 [Chthoniobacter sp.]|jgi:hypothetical protein|nr:hypothetical protein [Chthoniobacter sp.]